VDENECFIFANHAAEKIFGVGTGELMNRSIEKFVSKKDYKRIEDQTKLRKKGEKSSYEVEIMQPNGNTVPIIITATPKFDDDGKFLGVYGIFRDISEMKKAQKLQNELTIAQNSAKLKERFLANISHEMRTPMNGIIGMSDFLAQTKLDEQQKDYVSTIKDSSESLLNIINDVLTLSKLEQGQVSFLIENIFLQEFLNNTISIFKAQALNKNLNLSIFVSEKLPQHILIDKQHLRQILYNLISNAVKYTKKGFVDIQVEELKKADNIATIRITVKDTGIGIKESDKRKIFDPFVRVDESLTRTTEGTGLGLTITKRLVEELGGNLYFKSEEGKGSTFWFAFQAEIGDILSNDKENEDREKNFKLHILIAEDKKLNQKVASMILKNMGCTYEFAQNGLEVIENFEENKYDIILMDIMMPEMDGIEAMKQLQQKYRNLPPIIGLSAHALEGDAERFIEMGMDDYLEKPIDKQKLVEKLCKWTSLDKEG
jgi:PAS domain S-box-containing protein